MSINEIIAAYIAAKAEETSAKKRAAAMKELILQHASGKDNFTTDVYTVVIKTTSSIRLDTDSLYKDFPDIKETYGKVTVSRSLDAHALQAAEGKTA